MKARVKKLNADLKETVVLYCVAEEKAEKITRILSGYNVKVITAGIEESGQNLGTVFGLPEFPRNAEAEAVPEAEHEMIFFGGFNPNRIELMIGRMRTAGVNVQYKAYMTASNQGWPVAVIVNQAVREHLTMSKLGQLDSLSRQLLRYNPRVLPDQARKEAMEALTRAHAILNHPRGVAPEIVDVTIAALQRSVAAAMAGVSAARAAAAANQAAPAAEETAEAPAETQE